MSNELESPTVVTWKVLEKEDVEETGYVLLPTSPTQDGYISKGPATLFASLEEANAAVAHVVRQGLPIGAVRVAEAKLSHHRMLQVKDEPAQKPSLIVTP